MSLSPQVRRERRAQAAKYREPKKFPRRRCANCGGFFLKTRKNKKFCKPQCKDEYNRYGSAFGPLKDYLTKLIETQSKEEAAAQFAAYVAGKDFRRQLAAAGFIHRSMIKRQPPELTPAGLAGALEMLNRLLKELEPRIAKLEAAGLVPRRLEQLQNFGATPAEGSPTLVLDPIAPALAGLKAMREGARKAGVTLGTNPEPQSTAPAPRRQVRRS